MTVRTSLAAILSAVVGLAAENAVSLIKPGQFHGNEITARSGEQWLGLMPGSNGFEWRPFTLSVRRVQDPFTDEAGQRTGIEVAVKGGAQPILLLKGLQLQAAKVKTAYHAPLGSPLPDQDALTLRCPDGCGMNRLRIVGRTAGNNSGARLMLESADGVVQKLYEWPKGLIDPRGALIWAGDLDGDGKLDLLMDLSNNYNVSELTLFLSSKRSNGKLVERVAVFRTVGC